MGGSHPVPVLRTHMIMNFSPLPDIFFANPFIALLVLEDSLVENIAALKATPVTKVNKENPRTVQTHQLEIAIRDHFDQLLEKLERQIVEHLMLTEKRLRPGGRNPRFDNMMQFILIRKEMIYEEKIQFHEQLEDLRRQGKNVEEAELLRQIKNREEQLKTFGSSILQKVREAMKAVELSLTVSEMKKQDAKIRIQQIDVALKAASSSEQLQEYRNLRIELTTLPKNRTKGSRIPIECRLFVY